ncbi:branched-chain amino acid ABC transporter [Streptomyces albus subsp. chlorinus]|uniref:AzlD domain-containing protein n=1 Tax=Streptomyces albus TaxID=1888 RepID=UPI00156E850F|nr:AzlD domain-containing protein [Streptomyces albus]NSC20421.1 branched-chain amino acid ABC transporter [Streptomyces albus subsp. chlorinus]
MTPWPAVVAVAALSFALKAAGPALLGERELPPRARAVIALMAPALLAGLVTVEVADEGWRTVDPALLTALTAVPLLRWFRLPMPAVLFGAAALAAAVRALTT